MIKILFLSLCLSLVISKPVDCSNGVNVLEVKVDCSDLYVCKTNCADFVPGCDINYAKISDEDSSRRITPFQSLFFELDLEKGNYSKEAFERTCITREFTQFPLKFEKGLQRDRQAFLQLINTSKNVQEALFVFAWSSKLLFFNGKKKLDNKEVSRLLTRGESELLYLKTLIKSFTKEEADQYQMIRTLLVEKVTNYLINSYGKKYLFSDNMYNFFRRYVKDIGAPQFKTTYFNVSSFKIIDKWVNNLVQYKKECEKGKNNLNKLSKFSEYDDKLLKNDPLYFGKDSSFKYSKDINSKEMKHLLNRRNVLFKRVLVQISSIRYCTCSYYKYFYETKVKELQGQPEKLSILLKEKNDKMNAIQQICQKECNKRKSFVKEMELKNKAIKEQRDKLPQ